MGYLLPLLARDPNKGQFEEGLEKGASGETVEGRAGESEPNCNAALLATLCLFS